MIWAWLAQNVPSAAARWLLGLAIAAFALGMAYLKGVEHEQLRAEAARAKQEAALLAAVEKAARIEDRVVYRTLDRWRTVVERGQTIIREVPKYVSVEADRHCVVPVGFVRVHDAAAANAPLPEAAGLADAADSGIALSAVAGTVSANYQRYSEVRALCEGLQQWAREVSAGADGDSP